MDNVVTFFGWFCLAVLSLAACAAACGAAAYWVSKAMERFEWAIDIKTRHEVGRSIGASAWWFSESPDTSLALRILSEKLINNGCADADQWRQQWREAKTANAQQHGAGHADKG
jgi:hypothetical protein